jgi:hypothetical protein
MVGIPIADLTNPDFDACSKTGTGFLMTYTLVFFVVILPFFLDNLTSKGSLKFYITQIHFNPLIH